LKASLRIGFIRIPSNSYSDKQESSTSYRQPQFLLILDFEPLQLTRASSVRLSLVKENAKDDDSGEWTRLEASFSKTLARIRAAQLFSQRASAIFLADHSQQLLLK